MRRAEGNGRRTGSPIAYRDRAHERLPHVVKFSGGRSSGMLLFSLLERGALERDRGDVVVFNNTAAEHPETYRFVARCRERASAWGIPFFQIEFQTYEDTRRGEWTRLPAYRLVSARPRGDADPDGFHWRGEVYEELLSWAGYVPNQFRRSCTRHLKIEPTRRFVDDWLGGAGRIPRLGHHAAGSRIDPAVRYQIHLEHGGAMPEPIFRRKHAYCWSRPHVRPEQRYDQFWPGARSSRYRPRPGGERVTLIGLRKDEPRRIDRVRARAAHAAAAEGEHVYMPLDEAATTREDVEAFWAARGWDLRLPAEAGLSNCVYCFLKGGATLQAVHARMRTDSAGLDPEFGDLRGTPCDIAWWTRMEALYGRDLEKESNGARGGAGRIGFFGARRFGYRSLADGATAAGRLPPAADCST